MMITLVALAILSASALMVLGNLRMVAQDTVSALAGCADNARRHGQLARRVAFVGLWVMIFALSYAA